MCPMSKQSGNEWPGQRGGCGECVRVHRHTTRQQPGHYSGQVEAADATSVYWYTKRKQPRADAKSHRTSGQVREEDVASEYRNTDTP